MGKTILSAECFCGCNTASLPAAHLAVRQLFRYAFRGLRSRNSKKTCIAFLFKAAISINFLNVLKGSYTLGEKNIDFGVNLPVHSYTQQSSKIRTILQ